MRRTKKLPLEAEANPTQTVYMDKSCPSYKGDPRVSLPPGWLYQPRRVENFPFKHLRLNLI
jgi:hypothetical protein